MLRIAFHKQITIFEELSHSSTASCNDKACSLNVRVDCIFLSKSQSDTFSPRFANIESANCKCTSYAALSKLSNSPTTLFQSVAYTNL